MFTHRAKISIMPDSFNDLSNVVHNQIMPALRRLHGFREGRTSIDTFWLTAIEETCWETKDDADEYDRGAFKETLRMLSGIIASQPATTVFETGANGFAKRLPPGARTAGQKD